MSPEESGQQPQPARLQNLAIRPPEPEPEQLPCPRCTSTNTKFCYYNNYNLSQPRHFCKGCRRYWTRGGTLRNVPVGGGTRKSSSSSSTTKRHRSTATATSSSSSTTFTVTYDPTLASPVKPEMAFGVPLIGAVNLNEMAVQQRVGFGPLADFGLGLRSGFNGMGFGVGTWDWPMEQVGNGNGGDGAMWQIGGGVEGGLSDGDGFNWPELATCGRGENLK